MKIEGNNSGLYIVAIVGIVAVVGILVMVMNDARMSATEDISGDAKRPKIVIAKTPVPSDGVVNPTTSNVADAAG